MLLSELEVGSYLCYSPRGESEVAKNSRVWMRQLKNEQPYGVPPIPTSVYVARRLAAQIRETPLAGLLTERAVLVPVPGSAPAQKGWLWPPLEIARALHAVRLAAEVLPCLKRRVGVRKSSTSSPENRPRAAEHYESLEVEGRLSAPDEIVLVDDVVTRGATLLAAASRLREAFPQTRVRAFAVIRTVSNPEDLVKIGDPQMEWVRLKQDGDTLRRP
jgi:phosphoribosylpyrophosphate synthetase